MKSIFFFLILYLSSYSLITARKLFTKTDETTHSNFSEIIAEHIVLDIELNFQNKK